MKRFIIYTLTIVILAGCEHESTEPAPDNTDLPELYITPWSNSGNPETESFTDISKVRIGEKIRFFVYGVANATKKAPLVSLSLRMHKNGSENLLFDTTFNSMEILIDSCFYAPEAEELVNWEIKLKDSQGKIRTTSLESEIVDVGILGRWVILETGIDPFFREQNFHNAHLSFDSENRYIIELQGDNQIIFEGTYAQNKINNNGFWEINLQQDDGKGFYGLFQIITPSPNSLEFYYLQTEPDIGLPIPTGIKSFDELLPGEHLFVGSQLNMGF